MGAVQPPTRRRTAIVTLCSLLLSPAGLVPGASNAALTAAAGQTATPAKPAAAPAAKPAAAPTAKPTAKPATAAAAAPAPDGTWPRHFTTASGAAVTLYQPQIASWENQKLITFYAAASYAAKAGDKPALGTVKAEADTKVSVSERLVDFSIIRVTESNFPTLAKPQVQDAVAEITKEIPQQAKVIALDRVLASVDKSQILPKNVEGVKADPPVVFFSKTPAVIVNIDGDPVWSPITGTDLKYAVNTNWDLFELETAKTFYLRHNTTWLKAASLDGAWTPAGTLPDSFKKIPADENWTEVKAAIPGTKLAASAAPKVFLSTTPAELILLTKEPNYLLVAGTSLLWVSNTESDVFRLGKAGTVYYLVAGRWFSAPDFTGPWTFASLNLPADFQKIPLEHERSRVLASVPGTDQAAEAVLLASIPQTARVDKKSVKAPEVKYRRRAAVSADREDDGLARRQHRQGHHQGRRSLLHVLPGRLVHVESRGRTVGGDRRGAETDLRDPGQLAVAQRDLRHRRGQQRRLGRLCVRGRLHGRHGGVGLRRLGHGLLLSTLRVRRVSYRPYYPTYGYSAWYNPWTGSYGRGASVYGPYGGAGVGARYNPTTGRYSRGAAAWGPYGGAAVGSGYNSRTGTYSRGAVAAGPYGARGAAEAYNPRTGTSAATRQGSGVYGSWGQTGVQRGDDWATTSRVTNRATGTTTRVTEGSGGGSAVTRNTRWRGWVLRRAERQR